MKKNLYAFLFIAAIAMTGLIACKKTIESPGNGGNNPPGGGNPPGDTTTSRDFQLIIESLPGENAEVQNLSALLSVVNAQNDPVIVNKEVQVTYNGKYILPVLTLPKGQYKLSKLILFQNTTARFATPHAGSEKAGAVTAPLQLPFTLEEKALKSLPVQVARIQPSDKAEQFGYAPGSFGNTSPTDPEYIRIRVQPILQIGNVVYDSIPVTLSVVTWSANGQTTTQDHVLSPGTNEVLLKAAATKYQLRISKWGTYDEWTMMRHQVQEGMLYSLGGNKPAKKLKEVLTYRLSNSTFIPETKTEYQYDAQGRVSQILHYLKDNYQMPYVDMTDKYTYTNGRVQTMKRYNKDNELIETTTFSYYMDGKLRQGVLTAPSKGINMNVSYASLPGKSGITGSYLIDANYQYTHYPFTTQYKMTIRGGNMYQTEITSSNGASETGRLSYDYQINPYIHLNLPDIYFVNPSRHNLNGQQKTYQGAYPFAEAYQYQYVYDDGGYPTELITKYRNYATQQHAYTIKTIYKY